MKLLRFFLPRIEYILLIAIFWGIVASGPRILNFDGDLPRHILTGNLILQTHHISTTDIFSFRTSGYPSYPHEWLAQVIFAGIYDWLGLDGIVLLTALIVMLTWGIVFRQALHSSGSFFSSLIFVGLGVAASQLHVLPRPHIFTYLLTATWLSLLQSIDEGRFQRWWLLPFMMLLWVNLHGMFVLGIGILAIYLVGDFLDHRSMAWFRSEKTSLLLLASALSFLATFVSPSGVKIWSAIVSLGSNAYITSKIPEYQSPNFHLPETWPFLIVLLMTVLGLARAGKKLTWKESLLLLAFTALGFYTARMIPLFAVVVTPIAATSISKWLQEEYGHSGWSTIESNIYKINLASDGRIWILFIVLFTGLFLQAGRTIDPQAEGNVFDGHFFPVEAVSWLKTHPQTGHMFNEFDWGGYLLLELWPGQQIFMDGHTHIYGEALTREYEQVITQGTGWQNILSKYDVRWMIIRFNSSLANILASSSEWTMVYHDQTAVIFVHK